MLLSIGEEQIVFNVDNELEYYLVEILIKHYKNIIKHYHLKEIEDSNDKLILIEFKNNKINVNDIFRLIDLFELAKRPIFDDNKKGVISYKSFTIIILE